MEKKRNQNARSGQMTSDVYSKKTQGKHFYNNNNNFAGFLHKQLIFDLLDL